MFNISSVINSFDVKSIFIIKCDFFRNIYIEYKQRLIQSFQHNYYYIININ